MGSADAAAGSSSLIIHLHRPFPIRWAGCLDHLIFCVSIAHKIETLVPAVGCCPVSDSNQLGHLGRVRLSSPERVMISGQFSAATGHHLQIMLN
jgi:hypothetical protein